MFVDLLVAVFLGGQLADQPFTSVDLQTSVFDHIGFGGFDNIALADSLDPSTRRVRDIMDFVKQYISLHISRARVLLYKFHTLARQATLRTPFPKGINASPTWRLLGMAVTQHLFPMNHHPPRRSKMSLQAKLDAFKADFEAGKPPYSVPRSVIGIMRPRPTAASRCARTT